MPTRSATAPARRSGPKAGGSHGKRGAASHGAAPAFPSDFVRRPALTRRLIDSGQATLALILAPSGYGKTALLAEWAQQDERPFIWFGFDHRNAASSKKAVAAALAAIQQHQRDPFVLVLDDAHLAANKVLRNVFDAVSEELPDGALIALASRAEPSLPIGRLRAQRALVEIRMHDLAMTPAEAAVLVQKAGLELEFEGVQTLVRRTEGWPAALYVAALSLRDQPDVEAALGALGGDDHLLSEYLRDEFLCVLPPELLRFVTRTSVLDELSGPFCDAVLDERGTAVTLAQLERMSQLLVPLDTAHTRYRWHGLLRDSLSVELRRTEPELEPQLHSVASAWYEARGDLDGAIAHAVAAGDVRRVGDLLWPGILGYVTTGRNELVQRWISGFSHAEIADYAPLALCAAHSALALGHVSEAQQWAFAAAGALEQDEAGPALRSLRAGLALIEALGARTSAAGMAAAAARAYDLEPEGSPWRPLCCFVKGSAMHLSGDRDAAQQLLEEGADLGSAIEPSVASLCLAQRIVIAIEQRDWELAAELSDDVDRLIEECGLESAPMSALVFASSAAARAHQGRADEAKRDLRSGTDLLAALGDFLPWYAAETRILLAHASLWLADVVGARTLLAEASRFARKMPDAVIFEHWFNEAWEYMDTLAETSLSGASSLTIAELRILRFLPSHRSFREIGAQLGVSANTVKTQAHSVYRKLGAASRSEAVARASDAGLLGQ